MIIQMNDALSVDIQMNVSLMNVGRMKDFDEHSDG